MWSLGICYSALSTCFSGARIDLNAEYNAIALALAECPSRPYTELIKSDVLGPSSSRSTRSAALRPFTHSTMKVPPIAPSTASLRPSPPSVIKVSAIRPSAAKPTRGELLAQLETLSWKPWSGKRKTSDSVEKDRLSLVKVPKLGESSSSPSTHVHKPERVKAPIVLSSRSYSGYVVEEEGPSGGAVE